ncbi:MAG: MBOAT family O-acyltransferase [Acidobacteriota bacterium]
MNPGFWHFDFYSSLPFWAALAVSAIVIRLLDKSVRARGFALAILSALMLLALPGFGPGHLALVLGLAVLTYVLGAALVRTPSAPGRRRKALAALGITAVLAFLAFFKYGFVQGLFRTAAGPAGGGLARMIGVSYFSFRMIHFLVEAYRGKIEGLDPLTYVNYVIFFPAFISGPINRYNPFASQVRSAARSKPAADLRAGGERIVHGLFKKFVLAQALYPHILSTQADLLGRMSFWQAALGLYAYAFYFYFDFAGYSDLAIGCARLMGLELPENFDNPFLKRNIRELWTNWHMSLTSWLVDYIYWPIVRKLRSLDYFRRHAVLLSNLGMIITFIGCGMWHGETANFILWGAYHGIGIAALTIYQREKRKVRSAALQKYFRSKLSLALGVFLTFNFFAFGLSLFVLDIRKLGILAAAVLSRL